MGKQIVFVHGLARKPPEAIYVPRLRRHLEESVGRAISESSFSVAYWTNAIEPGRSPLSHEEDEYIDGDDTSANFKEYSFLEEIAIRLKGLLKRAVIGALEDRISGDLHPQTKENRKTAIDWIRDTVAAFVTSKVAGLVYRRFVEDLALYFGQGRRADVKQVLRSTLDSLPADSEICLIAHSMGSIVALDLILEGTRSIDCLITIGSPLGVPVIQRDIGLTDQTRAQLPCKIRQWNNLYDRLDYIAIDSGLEDDFPEVRPIDGVVRNEFVIRQSSDRNHHKSYGYLRTPELGQLIANFLDASAP